MAKYYNEENKKSGSSREYKGDSKTSKSRNSNRRGAKGRKSTKAMDAHTSGRSTSGMENIHSNDISWWNRSPIYPDAVSVQHNRLEGYPYEFKDDFNQDKTGADPAVITINYIPTIGKSTDYNSPINRGFTTLFAEIVAHTNSSNLGFTQASLGMLTAATASVISNIAFVKRAYGIKNLYFNSNANYPRVLFTAMGLSGFDTTPWETIRVRLNTLIDDFNSLMLPKYISLYDRAFQLPYNIYADEDSITAKLYIFNPAAYYKYVDVENTSKCEAITADFLENWLDIIEEQLIALRSTSDLGLIMGAYRRAFPDSEVVRLDYMPIDFAVVPYYDRNMTWQINNMSVVDNYLFPYSAWDIKEDVVQDLIICDPTCEVFYSDGATTDFNNTGITTNIDASNIVEVNFRLNSYDGNLSDEFIMEATRLCVKMGSDPADIETPTIESCGTEIPISMLLHKLEKNSEGVYKVKSSVFRSKILNDGSISEIQEFLQDVAKFRNHPPVTIVDKQTGALFDLRDYYVTLSLSGDQLKQINLAAAQSMFLVNTPSRW